jgi:hypothetical protein
MKFAFKSKHANMAAAAALLAHFGLVVAPLF